MILARTGFEDEPDGNGLPVAAAVDPKLATEIQAIRTSQAAFGAVTDALIDLYRAFNKTRRPDLKEKLKGLYELLKELGTTVGVSRVSMDSIWRG